MQQIPANDLAAAADPALTRGDIVETKDDLIVLSLPGTNYQLHLVLDNAAGVDIPAAGEHERVKGHIHAEARRIDKVTTGGRLIDPGYGRPRRVQGRVAAVDAAANTVTVRGPAAFVVTPMAPQTPADFAIGDLVSFDIVRGATFMTVS